MIKPDIEGAQMMILYGAIEAPKKNCQVSALSLCYNEPMLDLAKLLQKWADVGFGLVLDAPLVSIF
jgi:hypothetical protein